jgi:membrane protease subunit HflC
MTQRLIAWIVGAFIVGVLIANTFYIVDQKHQAVVVNLGKAVGTINAPNDYDPGLKVKLPWQGVVILDKRNQVIDLPGETAITVDSVPLVVDAFVRYRINNPLAYYQTLRNETVAKDRLEPLITSSLRQALGAASSGDIINERRAELMAQILRDVRDRARRSKLGIDVIDLRIKRVELPASNQKAVFQRMQSTMQAQAALYRAYGEQQKREITAAADKEVTITIATAMQEAGQVQGQGDAQAATIFAQSFGRDPAFAAFYRSMSAYEDAFANGDTTMVLSPDSDFFKYFKNGPNAH